MCTNAHVLLFDDGQRKTIETWPLRIGRNVSRSHFAVPSTRVSFDHAFLTLTRTGKDDRGRGLHSCSRSGTGGCGGADTGAGADDSTDAVRTEHASTGRELAAGSAKPSRTATGWLSLNEQSGNAIVNTCSRRLSFRRRPRRTQPDRASGERRPMSRRLSPPKTFWLICARAPSVLGCITRPWRVCPACTTSAAHAPNNIIQEVPQNTRVPCVNKM